MAEKIVKILVLNGPNLNLLGKRKPEIYGTATLADIESNMCRAADRHGADMEFFQSNSESALIDAIHTARATSDAIIINPAAYSHTSIAIRDALEAFDKPVVEVHLSNIHARESFRHHSHVSAVAKAVFCGTGAAGYEYALDFLVTTLR